MSLVGPRPTLQAQVDRYDERQRRRLDARPGLTGWAQVNGRASLPWAERIELDLWYLEHASLRLDLRIIALSVRMAVTGHGLYRGETGGWREPPTKGRLPGPCRCTASWNVAQRVEDLVVHRRAAHVVAPGRRGHGVRHVRRVLEHQHVVAAVLLAEQRLQLVDRALRRARLVLQLDPAVLERVDEHAQPRRVAGVVDAVLVPDRVVVARGRRVRLVVRRLEVLRLVRVALDRGVDELAAGRRGRLLEVRRLLRRDLGATSLTLVPRAAVAAAAAAAAEDAAGQQRDDARDHQHDEQAAEHELEPLAPRGRATARRLALLRARCRRFSFSSARLDIRRREGSGRTWVTTHGAGARAAGWRPTSSAKAAISSVSRRGATRSSSSELASSRRAFGSSAASIPASENGCTMSYWWPITSAGAVNVAPLLARRRGAPEEQALQHGGARLRVLADPVEQDVELPRQPAARHAAGREGQRAHAALARGQREHQRREGDRAAEQRVVEHRHLDHHPAHPLGRLRGHLERDVRAQRGAQHDRLGLVQVVEQRHHLAAERRHRVAPLVARPVGARRGRAGRASRRGGRAPPARAPATRACAGRTAGRAAAR